MGFAYHTTTQPSLFLSIEYDNIQYPVCATQKAESTKSQQTKPLKALLMTSFNRKLIKCIKQSEAKAPTVQQSEQGFWKKIHERGLVHLHF